jgi:hypothetical protein
VDDTENHTKPSVKRTLKPSPDRRAMMCKVPVSEKLTEKPGGGKVFRCFGH